MIKMKDKSVSVVIPVYNEEKYVQHAVEMIDSFCKEHFGGYEIIIVDDGSKDKSFDTVFDLSKDYPKLTLLKNDKNRGKGYSVKNGMMSAAHEYVLFTDVDLSTPIDELPKLIRAIDEGNDVAIGSRSMEKSNVIRKQNIIRKNMGRIFNWLIQTLLFKGIIDTQCGFKCFKREVVQKILPLQRVERFCFDVELLYLSRLNDYKIIEVPIRWINRPDSRVTILRDSINMFSDLVRIRLNFNKGYYGKS